MRSIVLASLMLVAVGCHKENKQPTTPIQHLAPIEHPVSGQACTDVYYHIVALKVLELGVPMNEDGTFNEEDTKRLAYGVDQEFRRRGTASWFFNRCMSLNSGQVECMERSNSIPLMDLCQELYAEQPR